MTPQPRTLAVRDHAAPRRGFRRNLPRRLNMAAQVCADRAVAKPEGSAILYWSPEGMARVTCGRLDAMFGRLAHALGAKRGDRVGVLPTQSAVAEAAVIGKPNPLRTEIVKACVALPITVTARSCCGRWRGW